MSMSDIFLHDPTVKNDAIQKIEDKSTMLLLETESLRVNTVYGLLLFRVDITRVLEITMDFVGKF